MDKIRNSMFFNCCKRLKMAKPNPHDRSRPEVVDEEDPVEQMLMKTGCIELHYAVQVKCFSPSSVHLLPIAFRGIPTMNLMQYFTTSYRV